MVIEEEKHRSSDFPRERQAEAVADQQPDPQADDDTNEVEHQESAHDVPRRKRQAQGLQRVMNDCGGNQSLNVVRVQPAFLSRQRQGRVKDMRKLATDDSVKLSIVPEPFSEWDLISQEVRQRKSNGTSRPNLGVTHGMGPGKQRGLREAPSELALWAVFYFRANN
jgi:hypothetical protein